MIYNIYTKVACYVVCTEVAPCLVRQSHLALLGLGSSQSNLCLGRSAESHHRRSWAEKWSGCMNMPERSQSFRNLHTAPTEGMQVPSGACIHWKVQAAQVVKICRFFQLKSVVYPRKVLWCLLRHWRKIQLWSLPARTTLLYVCLWCVCVCVCFANGSC